jgi:hypothetical protein
VGCDIGVSSSAGLLKYGFPATKLSTILAVMAMVVLVAVLTARLRRVGGARRPPHAHAGACQYSENR